MVGDAVGGVEGARCICGLVDDSFGWLRYFSTAISQAQVSSGRISRRKLENSGMQLHAIDRDLFHI
jgi:hypothetical protein